MVKGQKNKSRVSKDRGKRVMRHSRRMSQAIGAEAELSKRDEGDQGSSIINSSNSTISYGELTSSPIHYYIHSQQQVMGVQSQTYSSEVQNLFRDRTRDRNIILKSIRKQKQLKRRSFRNPRRLLKPASQILNQKSKSSQYNPDKNTRKACCNFFRRIFADDVRIKQSLNGINHLSVCFNIYLVTARSRLHYQEFIDFISDCRQLLKCQLKGYQNCLKQHGDDKITSCYIETFKNALAALDLFEQGKQYEAIEKLYNMSKEEVYYMMQLRKYLKWKRNEEGISILPTDKLNELIKKQQLNKIKTEIQQEIGTEDLQKLSAAVYQKIEDKALQKMKMQQLKNLIVEHSKNRGLKDEYWESSISLNKLYDI